MRFLVEVLGFEETALYSGDSEDVVVHAEARWPEGGGVMFGSAEREESEFSGKPVQLRDLYPRVHRPLRSSLAGARCDPHGRQPLIRSRRE